MANENLTPEQLALSQQIAESLQDQTKSLQDIKDLNDAIQAGLEESLGAQLQFATAEEQKLQILNETLAAEQERLRLSEELQRLEEAGADNLQGLNLIRFQELKAMEGQIKLEGEALTAQKERIRALKEQQGVLQGNVDIQNEAADVTERQLQETLGLKDATGDLADAMIDAMVAGEGYEDVLKGAQKAFDRTFTKVNLIKGAKNAFNDLAAAGHQAAFSADGVNMQFAQLDRQFAQNTGLGQKLGNEIKSLSQDMIDQHFTMEETSRAFETLATQSKAFTDLSKEQRHALTEQALQMERIGVSADTFASSIDSLGKTFGSTPAEINKTTEEMAKFGQALGVGPNKMLEDFNRQLPLLARYGKEEGAEIFRELATTAKQAGVEMEELVGIAKTFDTFEGAAAAAGKLNFILGGPLLNSVELLNANETERIQILKDSMMQSGKSFAQMDRFEKDLIAKTLNTSVDVAQKLFNDDNINSIEEATAAIQRQAGEMGSLGDQASDATTLEQRRAANQQRSIKTMEGLNETMLTFHETMSDLAGILNEYGVIFAMIQMGFQAITFAAMAFGNASVKAALMAAGAFILKLVAAIGVVVLAFAALAIAAAAAFVFIIAKAIAAGIAMAIAFLPVTLAIGAIGLAIYGVVKFWDELVAAFEWGIDKIAAAFEWSINFVVSIWHGLVAAFESGFNLIMDNLSYVGAAMVIFTGPIGVVAGALMLIYDNWDLLVAGFEWGIDWVAGKLTWMAELLPNAFNAILDGLKAMLKGFLTIATYAVEGFMQIAFSPLSALAEGAAGILDYIPGMGSIADGLKSISPARIINTYAGQIRSAIDAFKDGVTNYKGGTALVGEAGPELVTLPRGSNVITNENVNRLMGANKVQPAAPVATPAAMPKDQIINVTLTLDGDVLARHTRKVAFDTMTKTMEFNT